MENIIKTFIKYHLGDFFYWLGFTLGVSGAIFLILAILERFYY